MHGKIWYKGEISTWQSDEIHFIKQAIYFNKSQLGGTCILLCRLLKYFQGISFAIQLIVEHKHQKGSDPVGIKRDPVRKSL